MTAAWRVAALAAGVLALGLFAVLYIDYPDIYYRALVVWGLRPYHLPFLDTNSIVSALQCTARGFDPYLYNPCDWLSRAFVYSPLMLEAAVLPVSVAWNNSGGIAFALVYIVAIASLPPPRDRWSWIVIALAAFSTMSVFALERGNIDLLFFAMVALAGHLALRGGVARAAGYTVILAAALLKYYPIVALITALRERPRRLIALAIAAAAILMLFAICYRHGLAEAAMRVPHGSYFTDLFGAVNLPFGLVELLSPMATLWPASAPILRILPWLILVALILSAGRDAFAISRQAPPLTALSEPEMLFLVLGAVLIVGCFFAGQNVGYRGIYFLLLLPGLTRLAARGDGWHFRVTAYLILFLMWSEVFDQALLNTESMGPAGAHAMQIARAAFWLVRELIWWRVIGSLAALILCFIAETPIAQSWWPRRMLARWAAR